MQRTHDELTDERHSRMANDYPSAHFSRCQRETRAAIHSGLLPASGYRESLRYQVSSLRSPHDLRAFMVAVAREDTLVCVRGSAAAAWCEQRTRPRNDGLAILGAVVERLSPSIAGMPIDVRLAILRALGNEAGSFASDPSCRAAVRGVEARRLQRWCARYGLVSPSRLGGIGQVIDLLTMHVCFGRGIDRALVDSGLGDRVSAGRRLRRVVGAGLRELCHRGMDGSVVELLTTSASRGPAPSTARIKRGVGDNP